VPKCSRCGSYFIRPPCPVCSPPGVKQLIEDVPDAKGQSIEELQKELEKQKEKLKTLGLEYDTRIQELNTDLDSINGRVTDFEISKVSSTEKKRAFEEQLYEITNELESFAASGKQVEGERNSLLENIERAEKKLVSLNLDLYNLNQKKEQRQREEAEQQQREETSDQTNMISDSDEEEL
jgi:chromosome segregation ATPase